MVRKTVGYRDMHPNMQVRFAVRFVVTLATSMVIPFLAIFFSEKVGQATAGLMLVAIAVADLLGSILSGFWSNRTGRKVWMIRSEVVVGFSFLVITLINSPWLDLPYMTFGLFLLQSFFFGVFGPPGMAMLVDCVTPATRRYIYNTLYWTHNLAMGLGILVGSYLFHQYRFELFLTMALLSFASVLVTKYGLAETYNPTPDAKKTGSTWEQTKELFQTYGRVGKDRTYMLAILGSTLLVTFEYQLTGYIGVLMEKSMAMQEIVPGMWNWNMDGIHLLGFLQAENNILVIVFGAAIGILAQKVREERFFTLGALLYIIGFPLFILLHMPWVLILFMLISTLGEAMYAPIKQAWLGDLAPENERSSYMAVRNLAFQGAIMLGGVVVFLGAWFSPEVIAGVLLCIGLTGTWIGRSLWPEVKRRRIEQESVGDESA